MEKSEKLAVAEHALKQAGHEILFQNTEVLDNTSNHYVTPVIPNLGSPDVLGL